MFNICIAMKLFFLFNIHLIHFIKKNPGALYGLNIRTNINISDYNIILSLNSQIAVLKCVILPV